MSTFPHASKSRPGYVVDEVERFLGRARSAYDGTGDARLTSDEIRHTAFGMRKGGYSPTEVDAAMERLEDAFSSRERDVARREQGDESWFAEARESAKVITARLDRPRKHRFGRTSILSMGYSVADVDRLADRLLRYFHDGEPLAIDEVRTAVFLPQRGGYKETQVDLLLDGVTEVMLAVR